MAKQRMNKAQQREHNRSVQAQVLRFHPPAGPFDYQTRAAAAAEAHRLLHDASEARLRFRYDERAWDTWRAAVENFHRAIDAAYPPGFWEDYQRLRAGGVAGLESAIQFLEADPFFFRTGYLKTKLIRYIKPGMLTPTDAHRLQNVVLAMVDRRHDRDFRAFCRLARKVDSPELHDALTQRLQSSDPDIRRRARWVLEALEQSS